MPTFAVYYTRFIHLYAGNMGIYCANKTEPRRIKTQSLGKNKNELMSKHFQQTKNSRIDEVWNRCFTHKRFQIHQKFHLFFEAFCA